ncbi:unnamed protein product [Heterobilharzia americana]|nr:unnamed protein product [Heterobilharzia americana]
MSAGNNNSTGNLTGNLSTYQDSTVQIDQLIREIDKEGKSLLENTHQLVHLLIHAISKDFTSKTNRICESVTCPYRQIPLDQDVIDNWKYLVNSSNDEGLLDRIALETLNRNKEIETNYINIHTNAQSIKSRLDDQLNRFKSYIDSLNSTATFILNDLQSWWKRLSLVSQSSSAIMTAASVTGMSATNQFILTTDPISSNGVHATGYTTYANKSFISYQIDRLKQLTTEKSPATAVSLEDVGHQLAMTLAMQSKLITMKRELSAFAYKCGMSSMEVDYIPQDDNIDNNKSNSSDQILVRLLAKHVQNAIDIEIKSLLKYLISYVIVKVIKCFFFTYSDSFLENHTEQLRELRAKWEHYVKERDKFSRWLSERQTACHHLLELRSRSTQPEDEERRALEFIRKFPTIYKDFFQSLKDEEYQINDLCKMHQQLVQHSPQTSDPLLDRLNTEFKNLLSQTSSRIRRVEKAQNDRKPAEESHSEYRSKIPILPEKADALVQQSAKTLKHTKLLNELARSVRQLKDEVIDGEVDAQRSHSADRQDHVVPSVTVSSSNQPYKNSSFQNAISIESIRRNFPPTDYYPVVQLNKQSTSNTRPKSSLDEVPVWRMDDINLPSCLHESRSANQSKDSASLQYNKDDLLQYSNIKPLSYVPWKDEICIERILTISDDTSTKCYHRQVNENSINHSLPDSINQSCPRKVNSLSSHASGSASKDLNVSYNTKKKVTSGTQSPSIMSTYVPISSGLNENSMSRKRSDASSLNINSGKKSYPIF